MSTDPVVFPYREVADRMRQRDESRAADRASKWFGVRPWWLEHMIRAALEAGQEGEAT